MRQIATNRSRRNTLVNGRGVRAPQRLLRKDISFKRGLAVRELILEMVTRFVTTADAIDTPPYEAIRRAIASIPAINPEHDIDILGRASRILICAKDQGTYIDAVRYQAQSDVQQYEEVLIPTADAPVSQHESLLQRQTQISQDMGQKATNQKQAVANHYIEYGAKPIIKLMEAFRGANGMVNGTGTTCPATSTYAPAVLFPPAAPTYNSAQAGSQQEAAKFQIPLSWYSNMLTQQHTNMQIMNNVGGGSTNFHLANSSGSIIW
ncbi:hypothetical protein EK21DRAFT_110078 [Setomelanomma holmii]|uniref:Uncharacterized protein n=1 Tax=Setomelanomma holmii TaxID=210430 RepID=A0A9P4HF26_9PLEO|nr:hypothetical protein EK21DRAFT_110078 [Setomelanomma holmii]